MFAIAYILCGPGMMGAGKGGKGGKGKKFSTKDMVQGNYTVDVTVNTVKQELQWKSALVTKNGTTEAVLNQVRVIPGENKTNTTEIVQSKNIAVFADNATHIKVVVDGQSFIDVVVVLQEKENVYKAAFENDTHTFKYVIFNGLFSTLTIFNKATKDITEVSMTKERVNVKSPMWMKLLQPLALLANFWISKKMKAKQAAKQAPLPVPAKEGEEKKDNEGEEKTEGQNAIKDEKKDDKKKD